jgi:hypothetical protein
MAKKLEFQPPPPPNFYDTDDLAMALEKEEARGRVRGIEYGASPSNYALDTASVPLYKRWKIAA